ncbi:MAG: D-alanyl-D-alanine carboxypeptidase/D-alanyl-D-alanine-endopeptidase [Planctomycetes bacterium]|nr:D-alanyl-D-alanine carboxypeptidase/D-alanyl-D-alanine-endopeptidase [Planctomycetota bacterium]
MNEPSPSSPAARRPVTGVGVSRRTIRTTVVGLALVVATLVTVGFVRSMAEDPWSEIGHRAAERLGLDPATYAFFVMLPDGQTFGHRAGEPMKPASSLKLVTAAVALDTLGSEAMIESDLRRTGRIRGGVLSGDLIVVGRGDPQRASADADPLVTLNRWIEILEGLCVERIDGDLVGDDTFLGGPGRREEWPADQLHRWYCAPSGALNLNDNCVDVEIGPDGSGNIGVQLFPKIRQFTVINELVPVSSADRHVYSIDRKPGTWEIRLTGRFLATRKPAVEWVTVEDPTLAYIDAFAGLLASRGIQITGRVRRGVAPENSLLVDRVGRSVASLVPRMLLRSSNLYADCLLRHTDRCAGGDGSFESAAITGERTLRGRFGWKGPVVLRDGSGLSHDNRVNARDMVVLLDECRRKPWGALIVDALPEAGRSGTLIRRFRRAEVPVRAKTGHVNGVTTLCGFLDTPRGEVVFALLYQGPQGKRSAADQWQESFLDDLHDQLSR